jgi:uncharacterized protein YjbI with pentapeptide repeats
MIIGGKIAALRKERGLSQTQLAERLSLSPQAVSKWERGESLPDIVTLDRIAAICGTDLNCFSESAADGARPPEDREDGGAKREEPPADAPNMSWDFSGSAWKGADLSGVLNLNCRFNGAAVNGSRFAGANFSGIAMVGAAFADCDFTGANLSAGVLRGVALKNCVLEQADLSGVQLRGCAIADSGLSGANLNGAQFSRCSLRNLRFEGELSNVGFIECELKQVAFRNVAFANVFVKNCKIKPRQKVTFEGCTADRLSYACIQNCGADMTGVAMVG